MKNSRDEDQCSECGRPMVLKPVRPYPVLLQTVFGLSFIVFIWIFDDIKHNDPLIWSWSGFQIALGYFLIRARILARRKVYRCVSCTPDLR